MKGKFLKKKGYLYLLLAIIVLISFYAGLNADFVNWDDPDYIYQNEVLMNADWSQPFTTFKQIFTQKIRSIYSPVTILSYSIDLSLFGLDWPLGWHLMNIVLHGLVILILIQLMERMGLSFLVISVVAVLYAIHPMRVEPVMWLTARKDLLFALFFFGGLNLYLKHVQDKSSPVVLVWVYLLFAVSLLTKVLAVTFPIVIFALHIVSKEVNIKQVLRKIAPMLLISFMYGCWAIFIANRFESIELLSYRIGIFDRVGLAMVAFVEYVLKAICPYRMIPVYPYVEQSLLVYTLGAIGVVSYLLLMFYIWKKKHRWVFFGLVFFALNILPTLQIIPVGQGYLADRYTYLPYFGLFLAGAIGMEFLYVRYKSFTSVLFSAVFIAYITISHVHAYHWQDSEKLWIHQLKFTPELPEARKNLAAHYGTEGKIDLQYFHYDKAVKAGSIDPAIYYHFGMLLFTNPSLGSKKESLALLNKSIELDPEFGGVHVNKGVVLASMEQYQEALTALSIAESVDARNSDIYLNQSFIYYQLNNWENVSLSLEKYLLLKPRDKEKWMNKFQVEMNINAFAKAKATLENALTYFPNDPVIRSELDKMVNLLQ